MDPFIKARINWVEDRVVDDEVNELPDFTHIRVIISDLLQGVKVEGAWVTLELLAAFHAFTEDLLDVYEKLKRDYPFEPGLLASCISTIYVCE